MISVNNINKTISGLFLINWFRREENFITNKKRPFNLLVDRTESIEIEEIMSSLKKRNVVRICKRVMLFF